MADKELTVFIVDVGLEMGHVSHHRHVTDLAAGMRYVQDTVATKVFRERKTDLVSYIQVESADTNNSEGLDHVEEVFDITQPLYKHLKLLHPEPSSVVAGKHSAGIIRALLFSFQKIVAFVGKRKYKKNITLVTNSRTTPELDDEYIQAIVGVVVSAQIKMTLLAVDFDDETMDSTRLTNKQAWESLFAQLPESTVLTGTQAQLLIEATNPKLVRPTVTFRGQLRIGANLFADDFEPFSDPSCLTVSVEGYPAVKKDPPPPRKTYGLDGDTPVPIQTVTEYQIRHFHDKSVDAQELENNDDEDLAQRQYDAEVVEKDKLIKAYKYGRSAVVLNQALEEKRVYRSSPGLDLVGVIEEKRLPRCYLTGEAVFIVAEKNNERDQLALSALVDSLCELESVAVARYVQKGNAEVQMVVLIPVYVKNGAMKRSIDSDDDDMRALVLTRLPFYEDEKIAAFPDLSQLVTSSGKVILGEHPLLPSTDALDMMTQLIDEMDLDKVQEKETDFEGQKRIFNAMTADQSMEHHDILVKRSIGTKRVMEALKEIAIESSKFSGGLKEYCTTRDPVPPLSESLIRETHPPKQLMEKAGETLKKLAKELKVEKVDKTRFKRRTDELVLDDEEDELSLEDLLNKRGL